MINVDDRLLSLADADELYLMLHIAKYMNKDNFAFPKNETLCEGTGWEIKKLQRVKARCIEKGFIEVVSRFREKGGMTANGYQVKTEYLSVFVNLKDRGERLPQNRIGGTDRLPQNGIGGLPQNGIGAPTPKWDRDISINYNEVLTTEQREKGANAPAPEQAPQPPTKSEKKKPERFVPPTDVETLNYFAERNWPEQEAIKFFNYYSANGWKVGRNPMKSWTHAAAGWVSRAGEYNTKHNGANNGQRKGPHPNGQLVTDEDARAVYLKLKSEGYF